MRLRLELPDDVKSLRPVKYPFALFPVADVKNPRENCGKNTTQREKHDDSSHHRWRGIEVGRKIEAAWINSQEAAAYAAATL